MAISKLEKAKQDAEALEIVLLGTETEAEIIEAIKIKKEEIADAKKTKILFYWVKIKSFINDSETVEAGLYIAKEANERLSTSRKEFVESFTGKVPDVKLYEIAKLYKVAIFEEGGEETRSSSDILAELVKQL